LLFFIIFIIYLANASGDTEIHNAIKDNPANSGQHTLNCNGIWCIMNEQYCDKIVNTCMACVYTKPNCTQHLDCLQYCIDKGVEQAIHDNEGTATEEISTPAWALSLIVVFLILFLVSCVGNVVAVFRWFNQRKQYHHDIVKTEEERSLTEVNELSDTTEQKVTEADAATPKPIQEESSKSNEKIHEFEQ
ncbi:hypothetical protein ACJMK2_023839, partial [Sinanodonta woodiana]